MRPILLNSIQFLTYGLSVDRITSIFLETGHILKCSSRSLIPLSVMMHGMIVVRHRLAYRGSSSRRICRGGIASLVHVLLLLLLNLVDTHLPLYFSK